MTLRRTISAFFIGLLVAPTAFTAFFYDSFYAYAQVNTAVGKQETSALLNTKPSGETLTGEQAQARGYNLQTGNNFGGNLAANAVGGVASCGISVIIRLVGTALGATIGLGSFQIAAGVLVNNPIGTAASATQPVGFYFFDCIARAIARALLQALTASIVDWINNGFSGNPFYVKDYKKFFTNIADQTIGEFIQSGPFAFLCSPFQLQVRLAIARSFARSSPSCTLSQITSNVEGFFNNFQQGGWSAFLSVVEPQNNAFAGYLTLAGNLGSQISSAQGEKQLDLTLGSGFLSFQEKKCKLEVQSYDAKGAGAAGDTGYDPSQATYKETDCQWTNVTPGRVIEGTLSEAVGEDLRWLGLQRSFDEIINALIGALTKSLLYGGLGKLSQSTPSYDGGSATPSLTDQLRGGSSDIIFGAAQGLLDEIDTTMQVENRYQSENQTAINYIESAQSLLQSLAQCWNDKGKTVSLTYEQQQTANNNAANAGLAATALEAKKDPYLQAIAQSQANFDALQTWRDAIFSGAITTTEELEDFTRQYFAVRAQGAWTGPDAILRIQQENQQLQADMSAVNQSTNEKLNECAAFPNTSPSTTGGSIQFQGGAITF